MKNADRYLGKRRCQDNKGLQITIRTLWMNHLYPELRNLDLNANSNTENYYHRSDNDRNRKEKKQTTQAAIQAVITIQY